MNNNGDMSMNEKTKGILKELTLEEKAGLCSGADFWHLKSVERLGLGQIMITDGPHGLRKQMDGSDPLGLNKSVKATCFPTASTTASSWDIELLEEIGVALGEECLQEDVSTILGPGANIKRSPLCGRNFEYISEDPYLTGHMAAALINGVQSKGVGTSLKHFVMNNQEARRMTIDAVVDERAQRELYLKGFEIAVKKSQPWTVMCSYNRVDGEYLSDHKRLLNDILKDEWGHMGLVVSDWGATNDRAQGIRAGMDLEMPSSGGQNDRKIVEAINQGSLSIEELDKAAGRVIDLILKSQENRIEGYRYDIDEHHALARKAAQESAVLLKNDGLLPLSKDKSIAIIGEFAKTPRYQGAGSSIINPHKVDNVCQLLNADNTQYTYAHGYRLKGGKPDEQLIMEAEQAARDTDIAIIFAGLTDEYESEGFDRSHIGLPQSHIELIKRVAVVNPNTVVVLQNGAPIKMAWADDVRGILECYLGGQAGADAAIDILYGDVNPSGKLAETFPIALKDNSSYNYFPGNNLTVEYRESIYVGYRYFDTAKKEVLFPFGHGLSYTSFEYSGLVVNKTDEFEYEINVNVINTGSRDGSEIVQVYVRNNDSVIFKAEKELVDFGKVYLKAGEEKTLSLHLDKRSFAYYNVLISAWHVDGGEYKVLVGASSRDIRLEQSIKITVDDGVEVPDYRKVAPDYYNLKDDEFTIDESQFEVLIGRELPQSDRLAGDAFTLTSTLLDVREKLVGRLLYNMVMKNLANMLKSDEDSVEKGNVPMIKAMANDMPLRTLGMFESSSIPKYFVEGILLMLNGKFFRGIGMLMRK